jgi:enoyl-CoA hydratase/carnithine racemase
VLQKPHCPRFLCLIAVAALGGIGVSALGGCAHRAAPTVAPTPPPATATWIITPSAPPDVAPGGTGLPAVPGLASAAPSVEPDSAPPGTLTCAELGKAIKQASVMQPGVVDRIVAASASADAPVADAAQRLATAYAKAVASKNTADEPDAVAAVSAAAADMDGVCGESGLESVG